MITIDQELIKPFNKSCKNLKNESERLKYIENKYDTEKFMYHRVFLHSGQICNLHSSSVTKLIKFIISSKIDNTGIIEEDFEFYSIFYRKEKNMLKRLSLI